MRFLPVILSLTLTLVISGCSGLVSEHGSKKQVSSSLVNYLYPDEASRQQLSPEIPTLSLPMRVGVAFVPANISSASGQLNSAEQVRLLDKAKQAFVGLEYIERIEIIPSVYLSKGSGFEALEQVGRLYDIDVIALVSYDQVKQSYENNIALLYWTIVGLYTIPGNENSTQTFVDTAVFDIKTRKMLFRAPGISKLEDSSTAIGKDRTLDEIAMQGFNLAVDDMVVNLEDELSRFKTRVKQEQVAKVERREGYSGSGGFGLVLFGLLALVMRRRGSLT
ncbi:rhombotarget lipoprotein [Shewanella maritima]|uniref:Rhombotarget lipoprotein n=1 Tax=Shewanella maritima TaxID=2520507 RepID=A0A411PJ73_9GAMM|nr:rhombotarget lipoprotein [Shewanella maritima]QBF83651.1 rhombotarget lipoprotein [Shewanella maritima]